MSIGRVDSWSQPEVKGKTASIKQNSILRVNAISSIKVEPLVVNIVGVSHRVSRQFKVVGICVNRLVFNELSVVRNIELNEGKTLIYKLLKAKSILLLPAYFTVLPASCRVVVCKLSSC